MFNFPFFRFPYSNYYTYYNSYMHTNKKISHEENKNIQDEKIVNNNQKNNHSIDNESSKYNFSGLINFINPFTDSINTDNPILEVFGFRIYLDDLIILGLLFLLYKENVQDEMLFLALLLLLIS